MTSLNRLISTALVSCLGLAWLSCAPPPKPEETPISKAYRLIDNQQTDDAISYLEELLKEKPDNQDYTVTLASAYAHKAGVRIQSLGKAINAVRDLTEKKKPSPSPSPSASPKAEVREGSDLNVVDVLTASARYTKIFDAIPNVDDEQRQYLVHAIGLLQSLPEPKQEDAAYRGLLRVVLFKSELMKTVISDSDQPAILNTQSCTVDVEYVSATATRVSRLLIQILQDIGLAHPKEEPKFAEIRADIAKKVSQLNLRSNLSPLNDASSRLVLKNALAMSGFGKLLQCSSRN